MPSDDLSRARSRPARRAIVTAVLSLALLAWAERSVVAQTLSGSYKGTISYTPRNGVTTYDDRGATLEIASDPRQGRVAIVTYSDQLGHYREVCAITDNPDGTITLTGISYTILAGSSFSLDTFTLRVAADGSLSGTSVDRGGGTTKLAMHH